MHVGNTILVHHNHVRMLRSPINIVILVEKWNGRVDVFLKYLMGEVLTYLEAFIPQVTPCLHLCSAKCYTTLDDI
jgi:hypothetical protein